MQENNNKVCILLAVWGETFINDFLELSLPTLLAPGNLPAMAKTFDTRFAFLTRHRDIPVFEQSEAYQVLKTICEIEFISIEDLIVFGNYSTTLTFAYERAIQQSGEQMLNTYFVFLTSDYIMANGSMEGLIRYIKKGYSGICAGNFQVIKEGVEPFLKSQIDPQTCTLNVNPRKLLEHSFQHLHSITVASLFEQDVIHNYRSNRFFLRHDYSVLAGRFYLLHMLCIKPETMNYRIGSSCDYSFIPEMCPSGNIAVINDSDDYLVIEIQSKEHEINFVNWGQYKIKKLSRSLSEWTTKQHRQNANNTIYFHSRELTENDKKVIEKKLETFVNSVDANLKKYKTKPHINHPYWKGAIKSFNKQRALLNNSNDFVYKDLVVLDTSLAKTMFYRLFGHPPKVYLWHYRFLEYRLMMKAFKSSIPPQSRQKTIVFYNSYLPDFMWYCGWIKNALGIPHHYHLKNLMHSKDKLEEIQKMEFEICVLMLTLEDLELSKPFFELVKSLIQTNGKVLIIIPNERNQYSRMIYDFQGEFSHKINTVISSKYHIDKVDTIHNNFTMFGTLLIDRINRIFAYNQRKRFLFYILLGLPSLLLCIVRNSLPSLFKKIGHCTNIIVTLSPEIGTEEGHE